MCISRIKHRTQHKHQTRVTQISYRTSHIVIDESADLQVKRKKKADNTYNEGNSFEMMRLLTHTHTQTHTLTHTHIHIHIHTPTHTHTHTYIHKHTHTHTHTSTHCNTTQQQTATQCKAHLR